MTRVALLERLKELQQEPKLQSRDIRTISAILSNEALARHVEACEEAAGIPIRPVLHDGRLVASPSVGHWCIEAIGQFSDFVAVSADALGERPRDQHVAIGDGDVNGDFGLLRPEGPGGQASVVDPLDARDSRFQPLRALVRGSILRNCR